METPVIDDSVKKGLRQKFGQQVRFNVPLAKLSRWKIGGLADVLVTPRNADELKALRAWIHDHHLPSVVVGATSNLLFSDEGSRAIVIRIGSEFSSLRIFGHTVVAGPGVWVPCLARKAMQAGLKGLEHTIGIPGTLGGLVYMNGGSQRKGIGQVVSYVESISSNGKIIRRSAQQCQFSYRSSAFHEVDEIISEIGLELAIGGSRSAMRTEMLSILRDRRKKFPQKLPNCGSVFVSDPDMYEKYGAPGKVIEMLGYKDFRIGKAVISEMHANFIINEGGASSKDVVELIATVQRAVADKLGYKMRVEAKYVTPDGKIVDMISGGMK